MVRGKPPERRLEARRELSAPIVDMHPMSRVDDCPISPM